VLSKPWRGQGSYARPWRGAGRALDVATEHPLAACERAMAAIEASAEVRDAANRLAERYTAMAAAAQIAERGAVRELAQA
jgi:hypothetical protein